MSTESSQKWFERNRPPRVQISYDVETGGASVKRELPMVVGILADLGTETEPLPKRRFIELDRDNFDKVMQQIKPTLEIKGVSGLSGSVSFEKLEHFEPDHLVKNVAGLRELFQQRQELRDLMAKIDGNDKLHNALAEAIKEDDKFAKWGVKLGEPKEEAAGGAGVSKLSASDIAALAPDKFAASSDEELAKMSAEQLAAVTLEQVKALKERRPFTAAQIGSLGAELQALLKPQE